MLRYGIVLKQLNLSSKLFHPLTAPSTLVFLD